MVNPENLRYSEDHEWILVEGGVGTIGITHHAQSELGEIVYVEVDSVGDNLSKGDVFGAVEAVKTTSDLFMPLSGKVIEFNSVLDESKGDSPAKVNDDPYGEGWIIKIEMADVGELKDLLTVEEYEQLIG